MLWDMRMGYRALKEEDRKNDLQPGDEVYVKAVISEIRNGSFLFRTAAGYYYTMQKEDLELVEEVEV